MRLEELVPSISIMLETVAPEASYEQIRGQILQNQDFLVGGKSVSQSWFWNPGITGACVGSLWGFWEVSGKYFN